MLRTNGSFSVALHEPWTAGPFSLSSLMLPDPTAPAAQTKHKGGHQDKGKMPPVTANRSLPSVFPQALCHHSRLCGPRTVWNLDTVWHGRNSELFALCLRCRKSCERQIPSNPRSEQGGDCKLLYVLTSESFQKEPFS